VKYRLAGNSIGLSYDARRWRRKWTGMSVDALQVC